MTGIYEFKRTEEDAIDRVNKWIDELARKNIEFVFLDTIVLELRCFNGHPSRFKALFRRTDINYVHPTLVEISNVFTGHTLIWTKEEKKNRRVALNTLLRTNSTTMVGIYEFKRTEEEANDHVNKWIDELTRKNLEFVFLDIIVLELRCFNGRPSHFKALLRRTDINYVHPTPIVIYDVIRDHTKIRTQEEKEQDQIVINGKNSPRGVDTGGDKETAGFDTLIDYVPEIVEVFDPYETTRGSMVDIILIDKINDQESEALQLSTSYIQSTGEQSHFGYKTPKEINEFLIRNIIVLLICMIKNQLAGLYCFMPTLDVKEEFARLAESRGSTLFAPTMFSKKKTSSKLNEALQKYRYIHPDFKDGVEGKFKDLGDFANDFLNTIRDNRHTMMNTPVFWSWLFKDGDKEHLAERAGNVAIELNVSDPLGIKQRIIHGRRGDMILDFGGFQVKDERKILGVHNVTQQASKSLHFALRQTGHQGLHPSKVRTVTCPMRKDRKKKYPSKPEDYTAVSVFPVISESGNLALRPREPSSLELSMSCDVANRSEYIEITLDKIAADAFPAHMCKIVGIWTKKPKLRIKCVFYFDELKTNPKKLNELRELYRTFAEREVSADAIAAYENAVTDTLIDREKQRIKENKNK